MNLEPPSGGLHLPFIKFNKHKVNPDGERRLPGLEFLPNKVRNHFIATAGEFCGTFLFLFFAFSATQVANAATGDEASSTQKRAASGSITQAPNTSALLYISLAFGFSLAVNAWVFFRISGGLFNPAVTLGMCLIGAVKWFRGGLVFLAQILGGLAAAGVCSCLFPGPLNVTTTLGGGASIAQGLFIEMFLTSLLVFTIFMLAAEKHKGTFIAPIGIGLALFIAELTGVYYTGGSLNPTRSFGPCVVNHSFPGYHWIYWLGPALGSILATAFYRFIKCLEYETANPGQDFNDKEAEVFDLDEEPARASDVATPNVVLAGTGSDYVADESGIYRSQDLRETLGSATGSPRAPKPPAKYGNRNSNSTVSPTSTRGAGGSRYDGKDEKSSDNDNRRGSMGYNPQVHHDHETLDPDHHDNLAIPADRYRHGPSAEEGLGGNYRVSGL